MKTEFEQSQGQSTFACIEDTSGGDSASTLSCFGPLFLAAFHIFFSQVSACLGWSEVTFCVGAEKMA
jgi:hypothetical protein